MIFALAVVEGDEVGWNGKRNVFPVNSICVDPSSNTDIVLYLSRLVKHGRYNHNDRKNNPWVRRDSILLWLFLCCAEDTGGWPGSEHSFTRIVIDDVSVDTYDSELDIRICLTQI